MEIIQTSLVILGANTDTPQVMWNGTAVPATGGTIVWDGTKRSITLNIKEETQVAEMKATGIVIKRV